MIRPKQVPTSATPWRPPGANGVPVARVTAVVGPGRGDLPAR
ncbi:Uncharacterised protein [Mycobacteroides abscessus subsp. abscessus]|nr:Uncharacterised protein [Mycobacteroides abscessus subsp. abscessus]